MPPDRKKLAPRRPARRRYSRDRWIAAAELQETLDLFTLAYISWTRAAKLSTSAPGRRFCTDRAARALARAQLVLFD